MRILLTIFLSITLCLPSRGAKNPVYWYRLSDFTTTFDARNIGRSKNISLAARMIDGTVIKPGQIFSVNRIVGARSLGRGFRTAIIFKNGELVDGIGGGVCQIASTLYNAALLSGLEIVERHPHSIVVKYVEPGRDATVSYGSLDLKFRNNTREKIKISLKPSGKELTAAVYSTQPNFSNIELFSVTRRLKSGLIEGSFYRGMQRPDGSWVEMDSTKDRYHVPY